MIFEYLSLYIYINHGDVAIIWDIQISTGDILGIYIYIYWLVVWNMNGL